jgi:NAD(P)-dependent dehydrogenase (short-subunit alcohol dehydrogenase family)
MARLDGRVGIITGAAQGIGREYALAAAAEGASVVVADISDPRSVVGEIEGAGGAALAVTVDVASQESTEALAAATLERFGQVDFLVNNAAIYAGLASKAFTDIEADEWDRVMAVNLRGPFLCCRAVAPHMVERGSGKIVNISSATALAGVPGLLHYVTSKGGVIGFTRALARELGPAGINVNTISPGLTMSEGTKSLQRNSGTVEGVDPIIPFKSIQRAQLPQDLVGAMLFLVSSDADYITGQVINVDGGWVSV